MQNKEHPNGQFQIGGSNLLGPPRKTQDRYLDNSRVGSQSNLGSNRIIYEENEPQSPLSVDSSDIDRYEEFNILDQAVLGKKLKKLATVTNEDILMKKRQKHGQLRIGDVVCLKFTKEIYEREKQEDFDQKMSDLVESVHHDYSQIEESSIPSYKKKLEETYKGYFYTDGITDQGIKIIPQKLQMGNSASDNFKQCLFRIEIKQECDMGKEAQELRAAKEEIEADLKKLSSEFGSEGSKNPSYTKQNDKFKNQLQKIDLDIKKNEKKRQIQEDNNKYELSQLTGTKLTYGQPIQFKHLFSGKYLTLNMNQISQEFGCSNMFLCETAEESWFTMESIQNSSFSSGQVINFNDFFHIKSLVTTTPFYIHIFEKPSDGVYAKQSFILNASSVPSPIKCQLFMSAQEQAKDKCFIQSGDVIRLKHTEAEGYLTTTSGHVERLLPAMPSFLQKQIKRMRRGKNVTDSIDNDSLSDDNLDEQGNPDPTSRFEFIAVNDEYANKLKEREVEKVFVEKDESKLFYTNSCWEIQRVNTFLGGNLILDQVYRLMHVGTGKFLALKSNKTHLILQNNSNSIDTLFVIKSDMQTKKEIKYTDEDGDGVMDNYKLIQSNQMIMIQSYRNNHYVQLLEDIEDDDIAQFEDSNSSQQDSSDESVLDAELSQDSDTHLQVVNFEYQDKKKQKMIFFIEEQEEKDAIYSYQSSCIFDELLEFYAFMNVWAIDNNDESYSPSKAILLQEQLEGKCEKILFILDNLEQLMIQVQDQDELLLKCKNELAEQGILDIICKNIEMIYYKSVPPPLFRKGFSEKKPKEQIEIRENHIRNVRLSNFVCQDIFREYSEVVLIKLLELILQLIKAHKKNSEKLTKYFEVIFQHFVVNEIYIEMSLKNTTNDVINIENSPEILTLIGEILKRAQKNSVLVFSDKAKDLMGIYNKNQIAEQLQKKTTTLMKNPSTEVVCRPKSKKTSPVTAIMSWINLIEPVKFLDQFNQNMEKQIMYLDIISGFCRNKDGEGVFPYQIQIIQNMFSSMFKKTPRPIDETFHHRSQEEEELDKMPLKFDIAKVGNVERPIVYFCRPKSMSLADFVRDNPILGEIQDNYNMQQRDQQRKYELIFDLHELTNNYENTSKPTWPYVDYICSVLNVYANLCVSRNQRGIEAIRSTGINAEVILKCIQDDTESLTIHEKLKQAFMYLARVMFIEYKPVTNDIQNVKRCYLWQKLIYADENKLNQAEVSSEGHAIEEEQPLNSNEQEIKRDQNSEMEQSDCSSGEEDADIESESLLTLKEDVLREDKLMGKIINDSIIWFLQVGPKGTYQLFKNFREKTFVQSQLKIKIKSLKVYLDAVNSVINENMADKYFIDNVKYVSQCLISGASHLSKEDEEKTVPYMVRHNWIYILFWLCKEIIKNQPNNKQMKNAIRSIEIKSLQVMENLLSNRLNNQVFNFLRQYRKFQGQWVSNEDNHEGHDEENQKSVLIQQFESIFDEGGSLSVNFESKCLFINKRAMQKNRRKLGDNERLHMKELFEGLTKFNESQKNLKRIAEQQAQKNKIVNVNNKQAHKQDPFDIHLMRYIFKNESTVEVREKALEVLIFNFSQRDRLMDELSKVEIIVTPDDYAFFYDVLDRQRKLNVLIRRLDRDEKYRTIDVQCQDKSKTEFTKNEIMKIVDLYNKDFDRFAQDEVEFTKYQNMLYHIGLTEDLTDKLLKRLGSKKTFYREMFQQIIDFIYRACHQNEHCQRHLLPDMNFYLEMLNKNINTGMLVSEIMKSNRDPEYSKNFIKFLIHKIIDDKQFKSILFRQLIKLASIEQQILYSNENPEFETQINFDQRDENVNQQIILKQIISDNKFREYLSMNKNKELLEQFNKFTEIKKYTDTYFKEDAETAQSYRDEMKEHKEKINLHLSIVDLVSACARNSKFGISQAQKLVDCEELMDSVLSNSIPFTVKKHYINLLYEVYLRKMPGNYDAQKSIINNPKFLEFMKWVIYYDLDNAFFYYQGLIIDVKPTDTTETQKKLEQVHREVERVSEAEFDEKHIGKSKNKIDKKKLAKAKSGNYNGTVLEGNKTSKTIHKAIKRLDFNNNMEFWDYLLYEDSIDQCKIGLLVFLEKFFRDYTVNDFENNSLLEYVYKIKDRLLLLSDKLFYLKTQNDKYVRNESTDLLNQISKTIKRIPNLKKDNDANVYSLMEEDDGSIQLVDKSKENNKKNDKFEIINKRVSANKVLNIVAMYIKREQTSSRAIFGEHSNITKGELSDCLTKVAGIKASENEISETVDFMIASMYDSQQYQRQFENERNDNRLDIAMISQPLKQCLIGLDYVEPAGYQEMSRNKNEKILQDISPKDLSRAMNMDLKLFIGRFFEFTHNTHQMKEIHDFVDKIMNTQEFTENRPQKIKLITNLTNTFQGLEGINDELILISILTIILQRYSPDDDDLQESSFESPQKYNEWKVKNDIIKKQLKEWQDVMFETEVPQQILKQIDIKQDTFLCNRAIILMNELMKKSTEEMQAKILEILKSNNNFFQIFYYINERLKQSKNYLLESIKHGAKKQFIETKMNKFKKEQVEEGILNKLNSIDNIRDIKYDVEQRVFKFKNMWREDEINNLLNFLNALCENCFQPAQLYLRDQLEDIGVDYRASGKITSIDLIYQVVIIFIEVIDSLGDYVFSDFRTYKFVPIMLDTIIEFIYGPCLKNQQSLGTWKKLISTINTLMDQKELGNYSGIHPQIKAQLAILYSASQVLLAICDIKDAQEAKLTHAIILDQLNIENMIKKMVDIFVYKIGGNARKMNIYNYDIQCKHYGKTKGIDGSPHNCIEKEYCEFGHMIPRDKNTIQTGFNIYQILQFLRESNPDHKKLKRFDRTNVLLYDLVWKDKQKYQAVLKTLVSSQQSAMETYQYYRQFNRIESKELEELIIKFYPDTYMGYIQKISTRRQSEGGNQVDYSNILKWLQKTRDQSKDKDEINKFILEAKEKIKRDAESIVVEEEIKEYKANFLGVKTDEEFAKMLDPEESDLLLSEHLGSQQEEENRPFTNKIMNMNISDAVDLSGFVNEEQIARTDEEEKKAESEKRKERLDEMALELFKFYYADNFYLDNIGKVEIMRDDQRIIETTFKIPTFTRHLTKQTRDKIPYIIFGVSQQEKLEAFNALMVEFKVEMEWLRYLGENFPTLLLFAKYWPQLGHINMFFILLTNLLLMIYLKADPSCPGSYLDIYCDGKVENCPQVKMDEEGNPLPISPVGNPLKQYPGVDPNNWTETPLMDICIPESYIDFIVTGISTVQTVIAIIVSLSYYFENREKFRYILQKRDMTFSMGLSEYGLNQGTIGRGERKSLKFNKATGLANVLNQVEDKTTLVVRLVYFIYREFNLIIRSTLTDGMHFRNVFYCLLSVWSIFFTPATALLLLDFMFKIKQLNVVFYVFIHNYQMIFGVLFMLIIWIYIFAFMGFEYFHSTFIAAGPEEGDDDPDFNTYCRTLKECLLSEVNVGMRAGGGVGDALDQPEWTNLWQGSDNLYWNRYVNDICFFFLINIIGMNIFFGIIIDSFAEKRDEDNSNDEEITGQCFICGLSKSKFEVENVPWKDHIFSQHNMHAYLAFILYVKQKPSSECTGVEKYVKKQLKNNLIEFYPIQRCLAIDKILMARNESPIEDEEDEEAEA